MPRWLKITGIGCGGLVGLFILLGILGAIVGGGETATEQPASDKASQQAQDDKSKEKAEAEQAKQEAATEKANKEAAEARQEAEDAKEEAAKAKKEAEEAQAAKAEAETPPEEEPPPASEESGDKGTAIIRVTGVAGEAFTGSYGNLDTTQSVDGTIPVEYKVKVDTGFMSFDSVTAVMQKASAGAGELGVQIVVDGEVVKETSTTAEYGVATVTWSPSE